MAWPSLQNFAANGLQWVANTNEFLGMDPNSNYGVANLRQTSSNLRQPSGGLAPVNSATSNDPAIYANIDWMNAGTQPTGNDGNVLATTTNNTKPAYDPQEVAQYDQAIGILNHALGRLPSQLDIAKNNIISQFNTGVNELDSNKTTAKTSYDNQLVQNQQNFRGDKNIIADQASQGLRGLLRMIGAFGAGGSSDARYVAPQAVTQVANQQRQGAGQVFSQNQRAANTSWNSFVNQDKVSRDKLADWQTQNLNQVEATSLSNKQDLLSRLADLQGKKAAYMGGSYTGGAQPFIDQAQGLSGQIDQLAAFNPQYTGVTPTYTAPTLDSYNAGRNGVSIGQTGMQGNTTPFLAMLLGQGDDRRKLQVR